MELQWSAKALSGVVRLHEFLLTANRGAAAEVVQALVAAASRLREHPRIGERLEGFETREIRRILVGSYEMRYEVQRSRIYLLRLWHTREHS